MQMCITLVTASFPQLLSDSDKILLLVEIDLRATSTAFFVSPVNFSGELPLPFPMGYPRKDIGDIYLLLETHKNAGGEWQAGSGVCTMLLHEKTKALLLTVLAMLCMQCFLCVTT